jgi:eukaryotic-like serine/threonine-protein kinase
MPSDEYNAALRLTYGRARTIKSRLMPPAPSIVLPRTFGRYVLFDFIGRGGTAEAYLARQKTDLGVTRRCVVKQIVPELASDPRFSEMLVFEAKLAALLTHANVVQVFDLGKEDDRLFIAMEYVEGFDLNDLLKRCSGAKVPLPFELGIHVVSEALKGLDYAHRRTDDAGRPLGIVHRDVSPSNLLVSFEGEVKVCDFGIARANDAISADIGFTNDEALKGKAGYMSPEHARGEAIDARSDVFAAGIILWELAAGRRLYRASEGGPSLLDQARQADIPVVPGADLPAIEELRRIVGKALAVDRQERYPSAAAMQRDLHAYATLAKLTTNPLKLGQWVTSAFGNEIVAKRRARERAAEALERGSPLILEVAPVSSAEPFELAPPSAPIPLIVPPPRKGGPRPFAVATAVILLALAVVVAAFVVR